MFPQTFLNGHAHLKTGDFSKLHCACVKVYLTRRMYPCSPLYLGLLALVALVPPGEVHVLALLALPVTRPAHRNSISISDRHNSPGFESSNSGRRRWPPHSVPTTHPVPPSHAISASHAVAPVAATALRIDVGAGALDSGQ